MRTRILFFAIASTLLVSACGGGGGGGTTSGSGSVGSSGGSGSVGTGGNSGGGGSVGTTTPPSTLSTITASNANKAAASGYTANVLLGASSSASTGILTGVSMSDSGIGAVSPVLTLVNRALSQGDAQLLTGVAKSQACSGGGTVTIDANLKNAQTISTGDTMSLNAQNCMENGLKLNGTLTISFTDVSGDVFNSRNGAATLNSSFLGFIISGNNETVTVNGDMKIVLQGTNPINFSTAVTGKSLQTTDQKGTAPLVSLAINDYNLNESVNGTTTTRSVNFSLTGNSASLGQFAYSVKTLQPFVTTGASVPGAGSLIVNGADSSVTVTAVNTSSVRLDYSAKGDGVITQTTTQSWSEFTASL